MTDVVDSFVISEPPVLTVSGPRTVCSACKAPLHPSVFHACPGNAHWHPAEPVKPVMSLEQRKALMFALKVCDHELVIDCVEGRAAVHAVRKTIADALIKGEPV